GDVAGGEVVAEDLVEFVSAQVFEEEEVVGVAGGGEPCAGNGVGEEGELFAHAEGHADEVDLIGVGEAGADEHFAAGGVPGLHAGGAEFGVAADGVGDGFGDGGDVLGDEVFV